SPLVRFCSCLCCFTSAATPEIYTLSLHDALPISGDAGDRKLDAADLRMGTDSGRRNDTREQRARDVEQREELVIPVAGAKIGGRSEEHTSELQSHLNLVCRLLLEKKKKKKEQQQK